MPEVTTPVGMSLPRNLDDIDADFLTRLLQARGELGADNRVTRCEESDVGMTAGYFSAIKRMRCEFEKPVDLNPSFIVKAWPEGDKGKASLNPTVVTVMVVM